MKRFFVVLSALIVLLLAACGGLDSAGTGDPSQVAIDYLSAKIQGDEDNVRRMLCSEMEAVVDREIHSFDSVSEASLNDAVCTFDEATGTARCSGEIAALYGTETTTFPLTNYRLVQEDGEWKWCGEAP